MNSLKGFTVLEITVAIGIIVVGLLGVVSLVVQNLQIQNMNKNYLIASMLAQEGLELVRGKRDTNWLKGAVGDIEWKSGRYSDPNEDIVQDGHYTVDLGGVINDTVDDISDPGAKLYIDGYGFYFHPPILPATATATPFFRIINTTEQGNDIVGASSTVLWQERGRTHKYVAETWLYNWR